VSKDVKEQLQKVSSDVTTQARSLVEQRILDYRIQDELKERLQKTIGVLIDSEKTKET
jgi:hypothetical protein